MCECDHVRMNVCARSLSNETKRSSLKNEEKNTTLMHQRDRSVRIETRNKKWKWKRRPKYPNKQQQHQAAATHMQHADMEYSTETFSKTEYKTKNTTAFQFDQSSRTGGAIMWTSELAFPMPFCKYYSTPLFLHLHARSIAYSVAPVRMSVHLSPLCEKQVQFKRTYLMKFVFLCLQIANLSRVYCVALLLATYSFTLFQLCVCAHTKLKILRSSLEKHGATLSINRDTKWERERERTKEFPSYSRLCLCTICSAHTSNTVLHIQYILIRIVVELIVILQRCWSATTHAQPFITPMCTISRNSDCKNWVNIHCFCPEMFVWSPCLYIWKTIIFHASDIWK